MRITLVTSFEHINFEVDRKVNGHWRLFESPCQGTGRGAEKGWGRENYKDGEKVDLIYFSGQCSPDEKKEKGLQFPWATLFVAEVI